MIAVWEFKDAERMDAKSSFVSCLQGKKNGTRELSFLS